MENMRIARREWWKWVLTGFVLLSGIWITSMVLPAVLCVVGPLFGCPGVAFVLYGLWIAAQGCVRPVGEVARVIYAEGEGSWLDE
jgi:hypothetical protein